MYHCHCASKLQAAAGFGAAAAMGAPTVIQAIQDLSRISLSVGIALIGGSHLIAPSPRDPAKAKIEMVCFQLNR
jgi:hypothetical protein